MPATANANMMALTHASSSGINTIFPDVCKTPTPGGPIPIPYPNIAQSSDTADGSSTVKVDGNPIMLKSSNYKMSTGDEAGSAQGVVSSKIKGKAEPVNYSMDVKADGANVFRLTDMMLQNVGNPNTPPGTNVEPPVLGKTLQSEECEKTEAKKEKDQEGAAPAWGKSGVVPPHRGPITDAAKTFNAVIYIRQTKPECGPWILDNHMPKPHSCMNGTTIKDARITAGVLEVATQNKKADPGRFDKAVEKHRDAVGDGANVQAYLDDYHRRTGYANYVHPRSSNNGYAANAADYVGVVGIPITESMIQPAKGGGTQTISYEGKWMTGDYDLFEVLILGRNCDKVKGDRYALLKKYINENCHWDAVQHGPQAQWVTNKKEIAEGAKPVDMNAEVKAALQNPALKTRTVQTLPEPRKPMAVLDKPLTVVSGNGVATLEDEQAVYDALVCQECNE